MAMTLFVKKPFLVDYYDTAATQLLVIDGGSVMDSVTSKIYSAIGRSILPLPHNDSYLYWDILGKKYIMSEDDTLEDMRIKLLYRIYKVNGVVDTILNIFEGQTTTGLRDAAAPHIYNKNLYETTKDFVTFFLDTTKDNSDPLEKNNYMALLLHESEGDPISVVFTIDGEELTLLPKINHEEKILTIKSDYDLHEVKAVITYLRRV